MLAPKFLSATFQPWLLSSPSHPFPSHSLEEHSGQTEPQVNFQMPTLPVWSNIFDDNLFDFL